MPTYEYQCSACGHLFEVFQKISDLPIETCPDCQGNTVKKLLSPSGFQLKGTGWYATDFRTKKPVESEKPATDASTIEKKPGESDTKTTSSAETTS